MREPAQLSPPPPSVPGHLWELEAALSLSTRTPSQQILSRWGLESAFGFLSAIVIVIVVAVFEGNLLSLRGCRSLTVDEVRRVSPILQELGYQYNLRNSPRFAIRETMDMNAWAHMRHIVLTKGIFQLEDRELAAIIAHELHHWRSGDSVGQHLVWACAWPVVLLYNIAARFSNSERGPDQPPSRAPGLFMAVIWIIAWPAWLLVKFPITLAVRSDMRRQEFEADAAVKRLGGGPSLITALSFLSMFEGGRTGWENALYATHPSTDQRIDRLQVRTTADLDHVEPPLGSESNTLVGVVLGLALLFAGLIAWGAVLNANRASASASATPSGSGGVHVTTPPPPPLSTAEIRSAEHTAARI